MNEAFSALAQFRLDQRVACVTGAGGLLGVQFVKTLVEAGASVVAVDIDAHRAAQITAGMGPTGDRSDERVHTVVADVSNPEEVHALVRAVVAQHGRLDVLVNAAAIDPKFDRDVADDNSYRFEDYPLAAWKKSLDVNLTGTFLCCQAVGRQMRAQGAGTIINVASTYGVVAPDQGLYREEGATRQVLFKPADYPVTKAGVIHLTKYLAAYWGSDGIRVNALTPHGVRNNQDDGFVARFCKRSPVGRMSDRHEANGALLFLASDASSYVTGANLVVDGGWTCV